MAVKFTHSDLMYHLKRLNEVRPDDAYGVFICGDGKYRLLCGRRLVFETESIRSLIAEVSFLYSSFSD